MPVKIGWYEHDQVIYLKLSGTLTKSEVVESDAVLTAMLNATSNPEILYIVDGAELLNMPPIVTLKAIQYGHHPQSGWAVIFGMSGVVAFVADVVGRFFGGKTRSARDLPSAVALLRTMRPHLADLPLKDLQDLAVFFEIG